jgi:cobalt/nickel transport system permease protein
VLAVRLAAPLGLALLVGVARAFLTGATPLAQIDLGPLHLVATREGAAAGLLIGCRVLASVAVVLAGCHDTSAEELFAALGWARVPRLWLEIAILMHRYVFVFLAEAECVLAAQRVRLGYAGTRAALRSLGSLAGIVILRCLEQAEKTYQAMRARGFDGTWPLAGLPVMPARQKRLAAVCAALVAAFYLLAERLP